jgi:acetyl esterase/lipase
MLFYRWCRQHGSWLREVAGLDPAPGLRPIRDLDPDQRVAPDHPPTLLLHGDADEDVPVARTLDMARALAAASVDHEFVILPGRGHDFDLDPNDALAAAAFEQALRFLVRHLGGPSDGSAASPATH